MLIIQQILAALQSALTAQFRPDCTGAEQTQVVTLSATPWEVSVLTVPAYASRAIITAPNAVTMYALNKPPAGPPTSGETRDGLRLAANQERVVQLAPGVMRTLQIASALAGGVVTVQWVP